MVVEEPMLPPKTDSAAHTYVSLCAGEAIVTLYYRNGPMISSVR